MNVLPLEKQVPIMNALVEGNSIRSTARIVGVEHKTVMRVLLRVGKKCQRLLDEKMRGLQCRVVEVDEIWGYVGKKEGRLNGTDDPLRLGDQYVFVAMDSETKLIPSYRIGKRNAENAWYFVRDLSDRVTTRMQLTSDGFRPYYAAVEDAFGSDVDYAMLVKIYGDTEEKDTRYSPGEIVNAKALAHFNLSYRTPEPYDSDAATSIYSADKCVFKEAGEFESGFGSRFCLV